MSHTSRLDLLKSKREQAIAPAGEAATQRQHDRGKLTARERVERLLDAGTFVELDAFGHSALSLVDGQRSLAGLSQALGGNRKPGRRFLKLISQLVDARMLAFKRQP